MFRQRATTILKEYLTKGFALDDERLKNPGAEPDSFDELPERIRAILASEKRFYQKVRDLFAATSSDHDGASGRHPSRSRRTRSSRRSEIDSYAYPMTYAAPNLPTGPAHKPKTPVWKRWWFWLIVIVVVIIAFASRGGGGGSAGGGSQSPVVTDTQSVVPKTSATVEASTPALATTTPGAESATDTVAPVTDAEVVAAFQGFIDQRAAAGVAIAKAVTKMDFTNRIVTVTFDPSKIGMTLDQFNAINPYNMANGMSPHGLAEFAGDPLIFNDDLGNRLRPAVDAVKTVLPDGTDMGSATTCELHGMGTGENEC